MFHAPRFVFAIGVLIAGLLVGAHAAEEKATPTFQLRPIGMVEKKDGKTLLRIEAKVAPALLGLDGYSHVWVFYWFDRNDTPQRRSVLQVHPRGNRRNPLTGVFATRSPVRPNLIALSLCKIRSVKGAVVELEGIDAFDKTPILDLKPYIPRIDQPKGDTRVPAWVGGR